MAALLAGTTASSSVVFAHNGETHDDPAAELGDEVLGKLPDAPATLPESIANIGGPFSLVNHLGEQVTDQTYSGKHMLVFFGYSNCQIMCSLSLKRIADTLTILQEAETAALTQLHPLVITVDPENDTPARLHESLASYHPALTGLTGSLEQLKPVYKAYGQKPSVLDTKLNESAIVSHSSYFYLMGPDGKLQTFFPPILSAERMADAIQKYLAI